jgi:hypothetical protein
MKLTIDELLRLPFLTTGQAARLAGGVANSTVRRWGITPTGKRGKSWVYRTADVLRYLEGETAQARPAKSTRIVGDSSAALERIKRTARGER